MPMVHMIICKKLKTKKVPTACFTVRIVRGESYSIFFPLMILTMKQVVGTEKMELELTLIRNSRAKIFWLCYF